VVLVVRLDRIVSYRHGDDGSRRAAVPPLFHVVGLVRRIFDMLCERAVSRFTQGELLRNKQLVQEMVADSWMEIEAFRLLTLQTAWKIDQHNDYQAVRADISAVKAMMQKVLHDVSARALQLHGSLGTTHEMPFVQHLVESFVLGLADGPTEVHKVTLARLLLKDRAPSPDVFPSEHLLRLRAAAEAKFADKLAGIPRG
jgi:alkylation response protein AidB-like acyl-CoA dehydrogenase